MRVFVAGATGVIGRALVPRLIAAGHEVTGMTRSPERAERLRAAGAEAVVCDALDPAELRAAVPGAHPEVVVHELTELPAALEPRNMERQLAATNRLRIEGTANLVAAARAAGARRVVAQSIAFAYAPAGPAGSAVKDEDAPLATGAPPPWSESVQAIAALERCVTGAEGVEGVVLRYGYFYGPGTAYAHDGATAELVRRRRFPIVGRGQGTWSFVHVDDAAQATVLAVERGTPGIYNVVDDEPARLRDWLPAFAAAVNAPRPMRVPTFVARLAGGRAGGTINQARGASNAKARRELGWSPSHATWRTGFERALG